MVTDRRESATATTTTERIAAFVAFGMTWAVRFVSSAACEIDSIPMYEAVARETA